MAWILCFVEILKRNCYQKHPLTSDEINNAEQFWVKFEQNKFFL